MNKTLQEMLKLANRLFDVNVKCRSCCNTILFRAEFRGPKVTTTIPFTSLPVLMFGMNCTVSCTYFVGIGECRLSICSQMSNIWWKWAACEGASLSLSVPETLFGQAIRMISHTIINVPLQLRMLSEYRRSFSRKYTDSSYPLDAANETRLVYGYGVLRKS